VSGLVFGPDGGLPAGYARWPVGTAFHRGHTPGRSPVWFGPAPGTWGSNRFDPPHPRTARDPGVCYLAATLVGVLLERVLRGVALPAVARRTLATQHAVTGAVLARDLVVVDLVLALSVHGLELADVAAPPLLTPGTSPRYPRTQALAGTWATANRDRRHPVPGGRVDGIAYVSRFGPAAHCLALWDDAADALRWGKTTPLGAAAGIDAACEALGIGVVG
jgi:hypothetical protein